MGERTILDLDKDVLVKLMGLNKTELYLLKKLVLEKGTHIEKYRDVKEVCREYHKSYRYFISKLYEKKLIKRRHFPTDLTTTKEDILVAVPLDTEKEKVKIVSQQLIILFIKKLRKPTLKNIAKKISEFKKIGITTISENIHKLAEEGVPECVEWVKRPGKKSYVKLENLDTLIINHLKTEPYATIREIAKSIRKKGLGDISTDTIRVHIHKLADEGVPEAVAWVKECGRK